MNLGEPCILWERSRQRKRNAIGEVRYPIARIDGYDCSHGLRMLDRKSRHDESPE